jgi:hypothetical protein
MLVSRLGLSQRRACAIVGQHRSIQRHGPAEADPDRELRARLRRFATRHARWGYRRAHAVLVRQGQRVNRKKIQRLWREEGLRVPPKRRKRQRLGESSTPADRLQATRPDHVLALDYQFDVTATGRVIKILHAVAAVAGSVEPGGGTRLLDPLCRCPAADPSRVEAAVAVDVKDRALRDVSSVEPRPQRPHRARGWVRAVREPDRRALALLIRLRVADRHNQAVVGPVHVGDVEGDELAAAERASEPNHEQGPVPHPDQRRRVERGHEGPDAEHAGMPFHLSRTSALRVGDSWPPVLWACEINVIRRWRVASAFTPARSVR